MTMAVMTYNFDALKKCVNDGNDVNSGDGQAALRLACRTNLMEVVTFLIDSKADINYEDCSSSGSSPLLSACFGGVEEIIKYLIDKGANVNIKDTMQVTPLIIQLTGQKPSLSLIKLLISKGADVNVKDENGKSLVYLAKIRKLNDISQYLISECGLPDEEVQLNNNNNNEDEGDYDDYENYGPSSGIRISSVADVVDDIMKEQLAKQLRDKVVVLDEDKAMEINSNGIYEAESGYIEEATECFREAYRLNPIDEGIMSNLSRALVQMHNYSEAEEVGKKRVEYYPNSVGGLCNLGYIYEVQDKLEDAKILYEKAYDLDPNCELALIGLDEVNHKLLMDSLPNVTRIKVSGNMENGFSAEDLDMISKALGSQLQNDADGDDTWNV